jgi:3-carboxy-cis,cis-muconate cycloisomerase
VLEAFILSAGCLAQARFMLAGLEVHPDRMRAKFDLSRGLIVAEAGMMAAAPALGRQRAHDVVYECCRAALARDIPLAAAIAEIPELVGALGGMEAVAAWCDPASDLGRAPVMVERPLAGRG